MGRRVFASKGLFGTRPSFQMAKGKRIGDKLALIGVDESKTSSSIACSARREFDSRSLSNRFITSNWPPSAALSDISVASLPGASSASERRGMRRSTALSTRSQHERQSRSRSIAARPN